MMVQFDQGFDPISTITILDAVLSQFSSIEDEEQDNYDDLYILPQAPASEALEGLYKLELHEEQQVEANQDLIQFLRCHERALLGRKNEKQSQIDIQHYFR